MDLPMYLPCGGRRPRHRVRFGHDQNGAPARFGAESNDGAVRRKDCDVQHVDRVDAEPLHQLNRPLRAPRIRLMLRCPHVNRPIWQSSADRARQPSWPGSRPRSTETFRREEWPTLWRT